MYWNTLQHGVTRPKEGKIVPCRLPRILLFPPHALDHHVRNRPYRGLQRSPSIHGYHPAVGFLQLDAYPQKPKRRSQPGGNGIRSRWIAKLIHFTPLSGHPPTIRPTRSQDDLSGLLPAFGEMGSTVTGPFFAPVPRTMAFWILGHIIPLSKNVPYNPSLDREKRDNSAPISFKRVEIADRATIQTRSEEQKRTSMHLIL